MKQSISKAIVGLAGVGVMLVMSACTTKSQDAPPLTGPSEFGQSVNVAANPDSLPQDGASQSFVTVTVRDANGQPIRGVTLRAETRVTDALVDFGRLSARSIVTGSDGRATLVYTAPSAPAAAVDTFTIVEITVTPAGTDFNNANARSAAIRLTPPNDVIPPFNLVPQFTVTPTAPQIGQTALFDASGSTGAIAEYNWNFGDGGRGSGRATQHSYDEAGTFVATLTVSDAFGRTRSISQSITVAVGQVPTAVVEFSPAAPVVNQPVFFNASKSTAPNAGTIASYLWDFGDGTPRQTTSGPTVSHTYTVINTYKLTLQVTDRNGRTATTSIDVPIQ